MGVDDERADIVEWNAAPFFFAGAHGQETAIDGQEKVVGCYIDHALHEWGLVWSGEFPNI